LGKEIETLAEQITTMDGQIIKVWRSIRSRRRRKAMEAPNK